MRVRDRIATSDEIPGKRSLDEGSDVIARTRSYAPPRGVIRARERRRILLSKFVTHLSIFTAFLLVTETGIFFSKNEEASGKASAVTSTQVSALAENPNQTSGATDKLGISAKSTPTAAEIIITTREESTGEKASSSEAAKEESPEESLEESLKVSPEDTVSEAALDLIKYFEGYSPTCVDWLDGHATIGYGELLHFGPCTAEDNALYISNSSYK